MALRGVLTHRKTRRLARLLSIPPCYALGILEALWHLTAEQHQNGDLSSLTNADIAEELFYEGDADTLISALTESGWLDSGLLVHDWDQHADSYVHTWLAKRTLLFASGAMPNISGDAFNGSTRERIRAEYAKKYPDVSSQVAESPDKSGQVQSIPVPEPVPAPEPNNEEERGRAMDERRNRDSMQPYSIPAKELFLHEALAIQGASPPDAEQVWIELESSGWTANGDPICAWRKYLQSALHARRRGKSPPRSGPVEPDLSAGVTEAELEAVHR